MILKVLESIGLISFESTGYIYKLSISDIEPLLYTSFDRQGTIKFQNECHPNTGLAMLTPIGCQLFLICGAQPNSTFYEYLVSHGRDEGCIVDTP